MKTRNVIRAVVVAGLIAWPGVETWRYYVAVRQREAAVERYVEVSSRLMATWRAQRASGSSAVSVQPVSTPHSPAAPSPASL